MQRAVGVFKSYCTRVGNGPFPTELSGEIGDRLRDHGKEFGRGEYGTTTGRPRRIGWLDTVAARYSVGFNGLSALALTRLDVLDGLPALKLCTAYEIDGEIVRTMPASPSLLRRVKPVYEDLPGWSEPTSGVRAFDDLPVEAQLYVRRVETLLGVPRRPDLGGPGTRTGHHRQPYFLRSPSAVRVRLISAAKGAGVTLRLGRQTVQILSDLGLYRTCCPFHGTNPRDCPNSALLVKGEIAFVSTITELTLRNDVREIISTIFRVLMSLLQA